ncbi:MAG: L-serine ammonia-lyase, iron-sulfur-dependent subunit beta [Acetanaerobacterium sp.]
MNIFDIIGPAMIGPSSSHTAGAARAGKAARQLLDSVPSKADITLYGSFAHTYFGHGTDRAIIGGILGFDPADKRLTASLDYAEEQGLDYSFHTDFSDKYHPNTAKIMLADDSGGQLTAVVSSVGGGAIRIVEINGLEVLLSAEYYTTVIFNADKAGVVADMSGVLAENNINIAFMRLFRREKDEQAIMAVETDQLVSHVALARLRKLSYVQKVMMIEPFTV